MENLGLAPVKIPSVEIESNNASKVAFLQADRRHLQYCGALSRHRIRIMLLYRRMRKRGDM